MRDEDEHIERHDMAFGSLAFTGALSTVIWLCRYDITSMNIIDRYLNFQDAMYLQFDICLLFIVRHCTCFYIFQKCPPTL